MCRCDENAFTATSMDSGDHRLLVVEGKCVCPQTGYKLTLQPDNPGINPDPKKVILKLHRDPPEAGHKTQTDTPVRYETRISRVAELVIVRIGEGQDSVKLPIEG
jgi:hypothetical protein